MTHSLVRRGAVLGLAASLISLTPGDAQEATPPARVGQEYDRPPLLLKGVTPPYPADSESLRGRVALMRGTIDTTGHVTALRVVHSVRADLDSLWLHALQQWVFRPARLRGRKVPFTTNFPCVIPKNPPPAP